MNEQEKNIIAQVEVINDMLDIVCKELNELKTIKEYKIELQETESNWLIDNKTKKEYKLIVTGKIS